MFVNLLVVILGGVPDRSSDPIVSAIQTAYEANLNAIAVGSISFSYSSGVAPDLDSALSGQWSSRSSAKGYFAVSGSDSRYERVYPLEVLHKERTWMDENRFSSTLVSRRVLTNGAFSLVDKLDSSRDGKQLLHSPQISVGTAQFFRNVELPLALGTNGTGYLHLGREIAHAQLHRPDWVLTDIDDRADLDGVDVVKLTFVGPEFRRVYSVDLEHGAIPLRVDVFRDGKLTITYVRQDIQHFSGSGWYPCREIAFIHSGSAREFVIDRESALGRTPLASSFQLEFPEEVSIINQTDMVRYAKKKVWDLRSLPSTNSPGVQRLKLASPPANDFNDIAGEREAPSRWPILLMSFGAILLLSLAWKSVMRWHRA